MQRLLLVNHDSDMYSDLSKYLKENGYRNLAVDQVSTGSEALSKLANGSYDVLVLNLTIPGTDMLGLINRLKMLNQDLPVLAYSLILEYTLIKRYLTSGVDGYCFFKKQAPEEMIKACLTIVTGKWYISPEMVELIVEDALYNKKADRFDSLSEREFEIFSHLVKDETPAVIAEILSVHTSTIALYKSRIMDKLRVVNLLEMKNMMKSPALV